MWLSCNCPDHVTESNDCKHIYAVEEYGKAKHVKSGSILRPLLLHTSCKYCIGLSKAKRSFSG